MVTSSEAHWVADAVKGDTDAFGRLVQAHAPAVCAIALAITRDPHGSEEVAQDVFLLAWSRLDQLRDDDSFGPWLRQLARNRSREYLRAKGRRTRRTGLDNDAVDRAVAPGDPARHALEAEEHRILAEALEALPDETREVLVLYYREERSVRQVATLLGLSEAAVKKRLSRARVRLRDEVADRFEGVVQRTIPGAALVVAIVSKLPPRAATGLGITTAAAGAIAATATVGLMVVLGAAALSWPESGGSERPGTSADERPHSTASIAPLADEEPDDDGATEASDPEEPHPTEVPFGADPSEWVSFDRDGHVMNPVFSPDGKHLAFEVNRLSGKVDLFVAQVQGDVRTDGARLELPGGSAFADDDTALMNPAWHPQGIVVFEGVNQGGTRRLYYHQPTGGRAAEMISTTEIGGSLTFPAISADGSQMAMVAKGRGDGDIAVRSTTTGKLSWLTDTPEAEAFPAFWDERTEILFTRTVDDEPDILAVDRNGRERTIAAGAGSQTRPRPAGDRVVFFEQPSGGSEWSLMSVDGTGGDAQALADRVRLPHRAGPAVSPDGEWVAWTAEDPRRGDRIYLARPDGSGEVLVRVSHTAVGEPALTQVRGRTILAYTALRKSGATWRELFTVDITDKLR